MKKILCIIPNLNCGGAERNFIKICNSLNRKKYEVVVCILNKTGELLSELNLENTKLIDLRVKRVRSSILSIKKVVESEKPEIIFSGSSYLSLYLCLFKNIFFKNIKLVGREGTILSKHISKSFIKKFLYRKFYSKMDTIICQCNYMKEDLVINFKIESKKLVVINNPINILEIKRKSLERKEVLFSKEKINILTIGRLSKEKQHCKMIELFSSLDSKYCLYIIGEGKERENIEKTIKNFNLEKRVILLGFIKNVYPYIKESDIFMLTSKYEGFPNVMLEAIALQIPVLTLKSPGGIEEIIIEGKNGYYINENNLKIKIKQTKQLKKENMLETLKRYNLDNIIKEYEEIF